MYFNFHVFGKSFHLKWVIRFFNMYVKNIITTKNLILVCREFISSFMFLRSYN